MCGGGGALPPLIAIGNKEGLCGGGPRLFSIPSLSSASQRVHAVAGPGSTELSPFSFINALKSSSSPLLQSANKSTTLFNNGNYAGYRPTEFTVYSAELRYSGILFCAVPANFPNTPDLIGPVGSPSAKSHGDLT